MSKTVIHDHDGHVDDIVSCILLWIAPQIHLEAIGITNGDCFAQQAYESLLKIATYLDLEGVEIALTEDELPNPFPDNWRKESFIINELPLFGENYLKQPYTQGRVRRTEAVFADILANSKNQVTIVATGPLTNIAPLIVGDSKLRSKVEEIIIMGGAFSVPGNVEADATDGSAEWNIYADPRSFKAVLDTKVPMKVVPLDVTNQMPVSQEFLARLEAQSTSKASKLALTLWSLVKGYRYFFWDTLTAAATIDPTIFTFKEMRIDVQTSGRSTGKTAPSLFGGRKVQVATAVDKERFEQLILDVLNRR